MMHSHVLANCAGNGTDQSSPSILHGSFSSWVPDRTDFLLGPSAEDETSRDDSAANPAVGAAKQARMLDAAAKHVGHKTVLAVACNTFHAAPIWNTFVKLSGDVEVVHMIDSVVEDLQRRFPRGTTLGVMSSTGTRTVGVYERRLTERGFRVVQVSTQAELHDTIYDPQRGIKAQSCPVDPWVTANFARFSDELVSLGAKALILGCTELPLVPLLQAPTYKGAALIDPMVVVARKLLKRADWVLEPLSGAPLMAQL